MWINLLLWLLQEDISSEDVTTNAVMPEACQGTVQLLCKQDGVIAGMEVFARVFTLLDEKTEIIPYVKDGDEVKKGDLLATVNGDIRVLLSGERTALNYLQRMSGIATYTRSVAKLGSKVPKRPFSIPEKRPRICVFLKNMQSKRWRPDTCYQSVRPRFC